MLPKDSTDIVEAAGWKQVVTFPVLGHLISHDGNVRACVKHTFRCAWASFYANLSKPILKCASFDLKMHRLNNFVALVISYRSVRWPYNKTLAMRLDRLQRAMISICAGLRKQAEETPQAFSKRRGKHAASVQAKLGSWSSLCRVRSVGWAGHIERNTANASWSAKLSPVITTADLQWRRANCNNRPQTRTASGYRCTRWFEGVQTNDQ